MTNTLEHLKENCQGHKETGDRFMPKAIFDKELKHQYRGRKIIFKEISTPV